MLEKMGFAEKFDGLYASAHLGAKKPEEEFYAKVMNKLHGVQKNEVLFWDDSFENMEGARKFGIKARCIPHLMILQGKCRWHCSDFI